MPFILIIGLAVFAYLFYTGKISKNAIFPIILGLVALFLFSRGLFPQGAITTAIAGFLGRGFLRKMIASKFKQSSDSLSSPDPIPDDVIQARALLGVKADDDDATIKRKYRKLLEEHHPDRGGDEDYARAINLAKDTLIKYRLNN